MNSVAEKLREALELLERGGWIKGGFCNPWGRCAGGALEAVEATRQERDELWDEIGKFIPSGAALTSWNDAPERTFSEVRKVFQKAIASAEGEL